MNTTLPHIFVGIDISKKFLDIHLHPLAKDFRVANSQAGINKLIQVLSAYTVIQIVFESSGGYDYLLKQELSINNYNTWQVQPRRIRAFIISEGIKAKTDKIDAQMIALFASQKRPKYHEILRSQDEQKLCALVKCRTTIVRNIVQENNKLQHPQQVYCKNFIADHIAFMERQLQKVEQEIEQLIQANESLNNKCQIIESMPGIGKVTACSLLSEMPELGKVGNKQIASILGVAPFIKQSGGSKGTASISGGRQAARDVLYMATLAVVRFNPTLKPFYKRLRNSGKKAKVALIAVMRKVICIINVMIRKGERWQII